VARCCSAPRRAGDCGIVSDADVLLIWPDEVDARVAVEFGAAVGCAYGTGVAAA
jgi:hypothetical protein